MFRYLYDFQAGFIDPNTLRTAETSKRSYSLQLSKLQDVQHVHKAGINSIDVDNSESRYLLSGCSDGSLFIHDINNFTGKPVFTSKCIAKVCKGSKHSHKYSLDTVSWYGYDSGMFVTSGADKLLKIWDANVLKPVEVFKSKGRILHHALSQSASVHSLIAVGSTLNHVELFDIRTGCSTHQVRGHQNSVLACTWSPRDEHILVSGGIDNMVIMWDVRSSKSYLKNLDRHNSNSNTGTAHSGAVNGLKFSYDGLLLLSFGTDNRLRLWETFGGNHQMINYGKVRNRVKKHLQFDWTNTSSPSLIYVPSSGNIYVLELFTGRVVNVLYGHFNSVNCCIYHQDYHILYTGSNDHNILVWVPDEQQQVESDSDKKTKVKLPIAPTADTWSSEED